METQFTFCEACGKPLTATVSTSASNLPYTSRCKCGGNKFDSDGYCEICGSKSAALDAIDVVELNPVAASASHRGRLHSDNQDSVAMQEWPDGFALALADGVSTSCHARAAADLAVQTALETLQNDSAMPAKERIVHAIQCAHDAVLTLPYDDLNLAEPQTTLVLAWVIQDLVWYGWVGDSRLYLFDNHIEIQLTRDDSWINEQLDSGVSVAAAQKDSNAHCITQCLGMRDDDIDIHVASHPLPLDADLMLCSDGLWNYCETAQALLTLLSTFPRDDSLVQRCVKLIDYANSSGGQDNISVVIYHRSHAG